MDILAIIQASLPWLWGGAAGLGVSYMLYKHAEARYRSKQKHTQQSSAPFIPTPPPRYTEEDGEEEERQRERELDRKTEKLREIVQLASKDSSSNGDFFYHQAILGSGAGDDHIPLRPSKLVGDEDMLREIADQIPEELLDVLGIAASESSIAFHIDLEQQVDTEEVLWATDRLDVVPLTDIGRIADILPTDHMYDTKTFYNLLVQEELNIIQFYDVFIETKRLYILIDKSGSMEYMMPDGKFQRQIWSRGFAFKLLKRAMDGNATYLLRLFDGAPHKMMYATNREQAEAVATTLRIGNFANGGTDIMAAIEQAVRDLASDATDHVETSDILIITDADDSINSEYVITLLAGKIRLHAAVIGGKSTALQAICERSGGTYLTFESN